MLQPALPRRTAFLGAVALFLYTPKWFLGPDYISQQFHFTLAAFLCFYSYQTRRGLWRAALGGVAMSFGVLAFPQSVFAAPVIFAGLFLLGRRSGEKRVAGVPAGALTALASCGVCAAAFLCYVLQALSPAELLERAGLILHDPQYDFTTAERLALLAGQGMSVARFLAKPALAALALTALAAWLGRRRGGRTADPLGLWLALFAGLATLLCLGRAVVTHGLDERTFVPVLALLGLRAFRRCRGTPRAALFWLGYLPGAGGLPVHPAFDAAGAFGHLHVPDLAGAVRGAGPGHGAPPPGGRTPGCGPTGCWGCSSPFCWPAGCRWC